jgi:hypothetical protein
MSSSENVDRGNRPSAQVEDDDDLGAGALGSVVRRQLPRAFDPNCFIISSDVTETAERSKTGKKSGS